MCPILSAQNPTLSQEGFIKNEQTLPKQQPQKKIFSTQVVVCTVCMCSIFMDHITDLAAVQ